MTERTCVIEGCDSPTVARGWCSRHYSKWRLHGDPLHITARDLSTNERFWRFVNRSADCWLWIGGKDYDGYGIFKSNGRSHRAHRFAYELLVGPIPDGLTLDHLCRVTCCVNPKHLEPVTTRVNTLRGTGPPAVNARRVLCVNGHPLPPNRKCKVCAAQANRRVRGWSEVDVVAVPIAVAFAERTHCPQGHPYDDANTYTSKKGSRHCRTCHRERERERARIRRGPP